MYSSRNFGSEGVNFWRKIREDLRERMKRAGRDEIEIFRFQLEELDWLIHEGSNPRTNEEIESEFKTLANDKQYAKGAERLRLESRYSILTRSVPALTTSEIDHRQMMDRSKALGERAQKFITQINDPEAVEDGTKVSEFEIKSERGKVIRMMLSLPVDKKAKLPAIIIAHDGDGVTARMRAIGRRLSIAGYATAIPFLELGTSWESKQGSAEDLLSVLNYLRGRSDVDKYRVGCLGLGSGGTCSLILATKSQYLRACFTVCSEVLHFQTLQTDNLRAVLSFIQLADDHPSVDNYTSLREDWWRAVRTAHGRMGFGAILEGVRRGYFDESSPNYDKERAEHTWSNILLFFDQELLTDRSGLQEDQVGIQFSKLSSAEKEYFLRKMRREPLFAKKAVTGFYAFIRGQLDEDRELFESFVNSNPELIREIGRVAAANFPSYSDSMKKMYLDESRRNEDFALGFVGNSSVALMEEPERPKLTQEERKVILDLALSSPKFMRAYGRSRGSQFVNLTKTDREQTLELIEDKAEETAATQERIADTKLRREFCSGFGEGLAFHVPGLKAEDLSAIRRLIDLNSAFAEGLKNGLNWSSGEMSEQDRDNYWKQFAWIPQFARGIGIGFGLGFAKLTIEMRNQILDLMETSKYFLEGCGYGYGLIEAQLEDSEVTLGKRLFGNNESFKKGYEESLEV
ncbi:MAG: dienelactone hydrolase family protein [Thaumarchaeota archaeon]|nr:dienelactone hydrolase family protein [Nitrososphaerota archaeon]